MVQNSISDAIFTKTQQKVLGLLFGQPEKSFYTNEIMRLASIGRGTISRELDRLVAASLLTISKEGNQNHYQANPDCLIYPELMSIARKIFHEDVFNEKIINEKDRLAVGKKLVISRTMLRKLIQRYHIHRLALFGSAARGELKPDSDIDLLVEFEKGMSPSLGGMVKLNDDLMNLFGGRKVDVATPTILNNPYRQRAIEKDIEEFYAA
ncbi:MAG: nucleotidyltransferase domain-containing protein [Gammaproteobacteria bacterium]